MPRIVIDARGSFFLSALSADGTAVPVYDDSNHGAALTLPASLDGGRTLWVTDGYSAVDATFTSSSWSRTDRLSFVNSTDIAVQLNSADMDQPGAATALPSTPFGRGLLTPTDAAAARVLLGLTDPVTLYVTANGDDGSDGKSWGSAKATIAAAQAALPADGGRIELALGTFTETVSLSSSQELRGSGTNLTTIKAPASSSVAVVSLANDKVQCARLFDLSIDGNKSNQSSTSVHGLSLVNTTSSISPSIISGDGDAHHEVRNVRIFNTKGHGFNQAGRGASVFEDITVQFTDGDGFHFTGFDLLGRGLIASVLGGYGFYLGCSSSVFTNTKAFLATTDGYTIVSATAVVLTGSFSQGNGRHGYYLTSAANCIVEGVALNNCMTTSGFAFRLDASSGCVVNGTAVDNQGTHTQTIALGGSSAGNRINIVGDANHSGVDSGTSARGAAFTYGLKNALIADTYAATLAPDYAAGDKHAVTLTGNITINRPTGYTFEGNELTMIFTQDSTGGRTVTWGSGFVNKTWAPNSAANSVSVVRFVSFGGNWHLVT